MSRSLAKCLLILVYFLSLQETSPIINGLFQLHKVPSQNFYERIDSIKMSNGNLYRQGGKSCSNHKTLSNPIIGTAFIVVKYCEQGII
jgi:hypothetical protein